MKLGIFLIDKNKINFLIKLNGKKKCCVFISGAGSNLKALIQSLGIIISL